MNKIMLIIGAIVVPLVLLGIVVTVVIVKAIALDKESKAYVDEVTPKILADLRKDTLFVYACDELKTSAKPEELDKLFTWFTKLGQFKEYKGSTGEATVSITTAAGKVIIGNYVAHAEFSTGPAEIQVGTVKRGDKWFVRVFRINSIALAEQQTAQPAK